MKHIDLVSAFLITVTWLMGVVLAKGFWSTIFAVCLPPYAWYLLVEWCMKLLEMV